MIAKCSKCHHEWQVTRGEVTGKLSMFCGWCGAKGYTIAKDYMETGWLNRVLKAIKAVPR